MLALAALAGASALGCGGEDGGDGDPSGGGDCSIGSVADISGNHGHVLEVSAADIAAGADKSYDIQGSSVHTHQVTLTAAHFEKLAQGQSVVVTSTDGSAHSHAVTVTCA
jgi:hypothetical protein